MPYAKGSRRGKSKSGASPTNPKRVAAALRADEACKLRVLGKSFEEIALALGYSDRSVARRAIAGALDRYAAVPVAQVRALEIQRVEALRERHRPRAFGEIDPTVIEDSKGRGVAVLHSESSAALYLKATDTLARLSGAHAPVRSEVSTTYSEADAWALIAEVRAIVRDELVTRCGAEVADGVDAALGTRLGPIKRTPAAPAPAPAPADPDPASPETDESPG